MDLSFVFCRVQLLEESISLWPVLKSETVWQPIHLFSKYLFNAYCKSDTIPNLGYI